jgi:Phosphotransferase enzyme family
VKDFNDYFINLLWLSPSIPNEPCVHPKRPGLPDNAPVFFTHGDLTPSNIILSSSPSGQPTIVAIIDWHQSGWYPAYWEYCKAAYTAIPCGEWETEYLPRFLEVPSCYETWDYYPYTLGY